MIIVNGKVFSFIKNESKILCKNNNYIESIDYINNKYKETLIKMVRNNNVYYRNLNNQWHNPIGPAIIYFYNNKLRKQYWLNDIPFQTKKEFKKALNGYCKL